MIRFNASAKFSETKENLEEVFNTMKTAGDGAFTKKCSAFIENKMDCKKALIVNSGSAALEMSAILCDLNPGDEVIMPSFTFCSTANAFVLQGAVPVFVDIRDDTLNIDENLIEKAITPKTKAICVVHYAGIACNMNAIMEIAHKHNLLVIEDAAQAYDATYKGQALGTIGDFGAISFHETKNIMCGEGGAFIVNDNEHLERAEIVREKGTNRSKFFRGEVDKYTWVDKGSSYLPSDIVSAYLYSVLVHDKDITKVRVGIWEKYYDSLSFLKNKGIRLPYSNFDECSNNGHIFYLRMKNLEERDKFISYMRKHEISCPFHYVPLHSAPAGLKYCRTATSMDVTNKVSDTLVRLPLFYGLKNQQDEVISQIREYYA